MNAKKNQPYVIVGMSGGVDSSVAALTLLQKGYRVEGLFMKNWEEDDDTAYCTAADDLEDAKDVCDTLEIPLHSVNFSKEYWDRVFQYFIDEYEAGRTPNPDILCNKEIKFKAFLDYALKLGADKIATGHYARLSHDNGHYQLLKGLDNNKDQSYFLHALNQAPLSKALFPIGEMHKDKVRKLAQSAGFITHNKKDSTGICFIGERKFKDFLSNYVSAKKGDMITPEGEHIGTHNGLMFYTLGQRQGLGIGGLQNSSDEPWYVLDKNVADNTLIVGQGHDHPLLFKPSLIASQLTWVSGKAPELPLQCDAKIRYRQACQACTIVSIDQGKALVEFNQPQRAITPGQSVVFYTDEECLGGGIIE